MGGRLSGLARGLLVAAVVCGLFLAATSIAQRLVDYGHSGSGVAAVHVTANLHDTFAKVSAALDQHQADLTQANLASADQTDVDAAATDSDVRHLEPIELGPAQPPLTQVSRYRQVECLKGFDPPP
ncbi:MAG: hypothetical protein ACOYB7_02785 [Mycobacterium sp.]